MFTGTLEVRLLKGEFFVLSFCHRMEAFFYLYTREVESLAAQCIFNIRSADAHNQSLEALELPWLWTLPLMKMKHQIKLQFFFLPPLRRSTFFSSLHFLSIFSFVFFLSLPRQYYEKRSQPSNAKHLNLVPSSTLSWPTRNKGNQELWEVSEEADMNLSKNLKHETLWTQMCFQRKWK